MERNFPYREAVGCLLYLMIKTRPDIAFPRGYCSRKMERPNSQDSSNVKDIIRYLIHYKDEGIRYFYISNQYDLIDFDLAGDTESKKSTTGYVIMFCGGPIAWCSRKQPIVAISREAEHIAVADCTNELMYLKSLIDDLTNQAVKIKLFVDNHSSGKLIKNGHFNRRSKHIDVRYHFINEKVSEGIIDIDY